MKVLKAQEMKASKQNSKWKKLKTRQIKITTAALVNHNLIKADKFLIINIIWALNQF